MMLLVYELFHVTCVAIKAKLAHMIVTLFVLALKCRDSAGSVGTNVCPIISGHLGPSAAVFQQAIQGLRIAHYLNKNNTTPLTACVQTVQRTKLNHAHVTSCGYNAILWLRIHHVLIVKRIYY